MDFNIKGVKTVDIRRSRDTKRITGTNKTDFSSEVSSDTEPVSIDISSPLQSAHAVRGIDALFFAVENLRSPEEQELLRAETLLNRLENVRVGLLMGQISKETLKDLSDLSGQPFAKIEDPQLQAIISEIETRARVELAKLERSESSKSSF